ncbi:MAG: 16S rRNA (adenine(1518)-N(6)/adenine(1519)-N(6))-dimethyltransferase RsmA [Candidatus Micrarchaeia archaeon]
MIGKNQMYFRPVKALGQNFLVNEGVARAEAAHATGKNVLELGPGYGTLTAELCNEAKHVTAVEKDANLYMLLKAEMKCPKLKLIEGDFFAMSDEELEIANTDILISNIPYNLSSKMIEWLSLHDIEAVLCLQKEFVEHMLAKEGTDKYSKLSVISSLTFSITKIMNVSKGSFRPIPKVDSAIIYLKPRMAKIGAAERSVIGMLMQHKKKVLKNAIKDSRMVPGKLEDSIDDELEEFSNERVFKLSPDKLLHIAEKLVDLGVSFERV